MTGSFLCFVCGQPALASWAQIPTAGWGTNFAKAVNVKAAVCEAHTSYDAEADVVAKLVAFADKNASRPVTDELAVVWPWLERLARAIFWQVYERPWAMPLVLVSNRLGVPPEAQALYDELSSELKDPILELYPEPGPHKRLDYHFFEVESDRDEDSVLWMRLPGGLVVYAYPGEL